MQIIRMNIAITLLSDLTDSCLAEYKMGEPTSTYVIPPFRQYFVILWWGSPSEIQFHLSMLVVLSYSKLQCKW